MLLLTRSSIIRQMLSLTNVLLSLPLGLGLWSFLIEPNILRSTYLKWSLKDTEIHLKGLRIVQLSDLHFTTSFPQKLLDNISRKVNAFKPDLILFSGDFLCHSFLPDDVRFKNFLNSFSPKMGAFCILGNHDYGEYVSRNEKGIVDVINPNFIRNVKRVLSSFKDVFCKNELRNTITERALSVDFHEGLRQLLKETPFKLLHNETIQLPIGLNITGLGEVLIRRCLPEQAFSNYDKKFPGITLVHNPDAVPLLTDYPGNWILAGHTHGQQIYIPWPPAGKKFSQKLTGLKHPEFCRGLVQLKNKQLYVNRGLGGLKRVRFNSPPEICFMECH